MLVRHIDIPDLLRLENEAATIYKNEIQRQDLTVGGLVLIYNGDEVFTSLCESFSLEVTKNSLEEISEIMEIFEEEKRLIVHIRSKEDLGMLLGIILEPGSYIVDEIQDS